MEITPNKISGSPQELADYFRCSGQTAPNLTTPKLSDAISGKLIWAVSIVTGILLIALGFISNPIAYRILFGVIILGIFAIPILLLCKYNSLKIAGSVFLFLAVVLALFLGVTNPKTLSDMAIEKISSQK
ncbi:MAG: hypothetical protein Q4F93_06960 [bacterium]|jgi:energy-coupling factor transporter transmembrane protein EcfT|nr:hypothetical protein [bacterium]